MDSANEISFWVSFFLIGYCYLGYGLIAFIITLVRSRKKIPDNLTDKELPAVTLVITAFQESAFLREKLLNVQELDYPAELITVLLVIDEPDQQSLDIIKEFPKLQKLIQPERTGKYNAICAAMKLVQTPIVVFSDANCKLNAVSLRKLVRHYGDSKVGAVAGEKKIVYRDIHSALGQAEGWYWEYESLMKKLDAGLYTVVGAAGELFSIRTSLFHPMDQPVILDDLVISLQICLQGYRIAYEPQAFASELPSASLSEEKKRKTRIAAGAFQSLHLLKDLLHPFRFPVLYFQFLSRRLFRWIISPLFLIILLFTNICLVIRGPSNEWYDLFLGLQLLVYIIALVGYLLIRSGKNAGLSGIPFYFLFMNYCILRGFFRFLGRKQPVNWEKAQRQTV